MQGGPGLGASLRGPCELAPQDGPPRALVGAPRVPSFLRPESSEPRAGGWGRGSFQAPCRWQVMDGGSNSAWEMSHRAGPRSPAPRLHLIMRIPA